MRQRAAVLVCAIGACLASGATALAAGVTVEETPFSHNDAGTAQALAGDAVRVRGNLSAASQVDYYSFVGHSGDRVYAAIMTASSGTGSNDTVLTIFGIDGTTTLEEDDDDGTFASFSSSLAGTEIPADGTYYLRVRAFGSSNPIGPYVLYLNVGSGLPDAEVESNDAAPGQFFAAAPWVSGAASTPSDVDVYSFSLQVGDTVFASLDLDPERDAAQMDATLTFGLSGGQTVTANSPHVDAIQSQALFVTVAGSGFYTLQITPAAAGPASTYHLKVAIFPADATPCSTFTSGDVPKTVGPSGGTTVSTITVPGSLRIDKLRVAINASHAVLGDMDVTLTSPDGTEILLFSDLGGTATSMDLVLDEDAAVPINFSATALTGVAVTPPPTTRLAWFHGKDAGGTWTLQVRDDTLDANGGTLNGWSLIVCEDVPPPCTLAATIYASDFESDDGGFTHSSGNGTDQWARGTPSVAPIATAGGGTMCFKTNLAGTYAPSADEDLVSPAIAVPDSGGRVFLNWAMKYQLEAAIADHAYVEVREPGGAGMRRSVWDHVGPTMTATLGALPGVPIAEAAGWGLYRADITDFAGKTVEVVFHLDTNAANEFAGLAIDDVSVVRCAEPSNLVGSVFRDDDGDGVRDTFEQTIAGVLLQLVGTDDVGNPVEVLIGSGADGDFALTGLAPSSAAGYTIQAFAPVYDVPESSVVGDLGGTSALGSTSSILVRSGRIGAGYVFPYREHAFMGPGAGDGDLLVTSAFFAVDWARRQASTTPQSPDRLTVSGAINPDGLPSDLAGARFTLTLNDVPIAGGTLTAKGLYSAVGTPSVKFKLNARTGKFSLLAKSLDLVGGVDALGLVDATATPGSHLVTRLALSIENVPISTPVWTSTADFLYGSTAHKAAYGTFSSKSGRAIDGVFKATKATAAEVAGAGHRVTFAATIVPKGADPLLPTGEIVVTIGETTFKLPSGALVQKGDAAKSVFILPAGTVPQLAKFKLDNAKHALTLTTTSLAATGIPEAGTSAATNHLLLVRIEFTTADGSIPFSTTARIARRTSASKAWKQ